jgi:F0F1-type ATP synthase delta subunit
MNKKTIDKLVATSYKNDDLDQRKVNKIVSIVSRPDLKRYINGLKLAEKKKSLIIASPIISPDLKKFAKLFPNKKIIFKKDPSLMLGVQITDNDMVYEFTMKNSLNEIQSYIEQNYD